MLCSFREKFEFIVRATFQHARNLALLTTVYKTMLFVMRKLWGRGHPAHNFVAAFVGGYLVFGENNKVNMQVGGVSPNQSEAHPHTLTHTPSHSHTSHSSHYYIDILLPPHTPTPSHLHTLTHHPLLYLHIRILPSPLTPSHPHTLPPPPPGQPLPPISDYSGPTKSSGQERHSPRAKL